MAAWSRSPFRAISRATCLFAATILAASCVGQSSPTPYWEGVATPLPLVAPPSAGRTFPVVIRTAPPLVSPAPTGMGCAALIASKHAPYPSPSLGPAPTPTIAEPDAQAEAAIAGAISGLTALHSFRFTADVVGRDVVGFQRAALDFSLRGTITHADGLRMDALVTFQMRETNGSGAGIAASDRLILGDGYAWSVDSQSGAVQPSRPGAAGDLLLAIAPEGLAERIVAPFAAGYQRVGIETHGGVRAVHLRASKSGRDAYAALFGGDLGVTADVWVAADDGYLLGLRIVGTAARPVPSASAVVQDGLLIAFEVSKPNAPANVIELGREPLPDPVRPSGPPVDMQLEYRILPVNGIAPDAKALDAISVAIRTRLDVSNRPVKVDTIAPDRMVVTVCSTTRPGADRTTIEANGALTIVPLPASDFGSTKTPVRKALPAIGARIDPALRAIAAAAGVGLASVYIDPRTGRRGVSFAIDNRSKDIFVPYAKAHPGEFVAVVLDGIVMAIEPIEKAVLNARFAFTGDYTEAETHLMVMSLYRDPLGFPLERLRDDEVPSS